MGHHPRALALALRVSRDGGRAASRRFGAARLMTGRPPNTEALSLYRDCLRACRHFHWCNKEGEPWCGSPAPFFLFFLISPSRTVSRARRNDVLRESTRKEFEQARHEPDPLLVARLLVVGRQCLDSMVRKFEAAQRRIQSKIEDTRSR